MQRMDSLTVLMFAQLGIPRWSPPNGGAKWLGQKANPHRRRFTKPNQTKPNQTIFIASCCKKIKTPLSIVVTSPTTASKQAEPTRWDNTTGIFFSHLHKDCCEWGDPDEGRVLHETATGCASSVKAHCWSTTCLVRQNGECCATNCSNNPKRKQRERGNHWSMGTKPQRTWTEMRQPSGVTGWTLWKQLSSSTSTTRCPNVAEGVRKCPC